MKPIVYYKKLMSQLNIGDRVIVYPVDRPSALVSNKKPALTSKAVKINKDGFETENSIYKGLIE